MGVLLHFSTAIKKAADIKEARLHIYFHKTKQELKELLETIESYIKKYTIYQKFTLSGFVRNKPAQEILLAMNEWPEFIELHLSIIHQTLGEEFALVAEDFPDDLLIYLRHMNDEIEELLENTPHSGTYNLEKSIHQLQKDSSDKSVLDELKGILSSLENQIKKLLDSCSLEEKVEQKEHFIVQQLLGNTYIETHAETFKRWWETALVEYFQKTYRKTLPPFSVATTIEKKEIHKYVHGSLRIPVVFLTLKITIGAPVNSTLELLVHYDGQEDKFYGESVKRYGSKEGIKYPEKAYGDVQTFFDIAFEQSINV